MSGRASLFRPTDRVVIAFLGIESALVFLFARHRLESWPGYLAVHVALIGALLLLLFLARRMRSQTVVFLRDWYPAVYVPIVFKMLGALVPAVHPATYDVLLLSWDRAIFGRYPGEYLDFLASPLTSEILRACWLSYFALPFLIVVPLYRRAEKGPFHETVLVLITGWLISFLGYYVLPALGPGYFSETIPAPESVNASGVTQSVALALFSLEGKMHDIFPSGHTIIAILGLRQAVRHGVRGWPFLVPVVAGLVFGTVYLRYHYGVDVLAGGLIAAAVAAVAGSDRTGKGSTSRA